MDALNQLDSLFEHRIRLAIAVLLARDSEISFAGFKQQIDTTDGNLGAQLRKLEDAGYIQLRRDFVDRKPVTWYSLTKAGKKSLNQHINALQKMISPQ